MPRSQVRRRRLTRSLLLSGGGAGSVVGRGVILGAPGRPRRACLAGPAAEEGLRGRGRGWAGPGLSSELAAGYLGSGSGPDLPKPAPRPGPAKGKFVPAEWTRSSLSLSLWVPRL